MRITLRLCGDHRLTLLFIAAATQIGAQPHFLSLPFTKPNITIQQGWIYTDGYLHHPKGAIDFINGTLDQSSTWQTFSIVAAAGGVATWDNDPKSGYGNMVLIRHDQTDSQGRHYFTLYAHIQDGTVPAAIPRLGRHNTDYANWIRVSTGDILGMAGSTGDVECRVASQCIHLHFEVNIGGYYQNQTDPYSVDGERSAYPGSCSAFLWISCPPNMAPSTGTIIVNGTLDSQTPPTPYWNGSVNYALVGPNYMSSSTSLTQIPNLPTGSYTINVTGGGPINATLTGLLPCILTRGPAPCTQSLPASGLNFVLQYTSNPPTAGFTMSSGDQAAYEGQTLTATASASNTATVSFDATTRSAGFNGNSITGWTWTVTGAILATTKIFSATFPLGTTSVSLVVTDRRGVSSVAVSGTVVVNAQGSTSTGSMLVPRFEHTGTLLNSGLVLVTGGATTDGSAINTAELYNPQTGTWRYTGSSQQTFMAVTRENQAATKLSDGRVLITGGVTGCQANSGVGGTTCSMTRSAEIFDPATETFAQINSMIDPHSSHAAVLLTDGRVMVVGGYEDADGVYGSAEIYDPGSGLWSMSNNGLGYRANAAVALLLNGSVLVPGGGLSNRVDMFTPSTNSWQTMTPLLYDRWTHSALTLPNGKVLVAGGNDGFSASYTAEVYDVTGNGGSGSTALVPGTLTVGGWSASAALLPGGDVYLAGGHNNSGGCSASTANAQLYNFASNSLSAEASLTVPRTLFSLTLLPTGTILAAGGNNFNACDVSNVFKSAELIVP
jgi:murein DD-endopeptidase MepM/ murein hydrolase activator NlpD